jgi:hypothetical protein
MEADKLRERKWIGYGLERDKNRLRPASFWRNCFRTSNLIKARPRKTKRQCACNPDVLPFHFSFPTETGADPLW